MKKTFPQVNSNSGCKCWDYSQEQQHLKRWIAHKNFLKKKVKWKAGDTLIFIRQSNATPLTAFK